MEGPGAYAWLEGLACDPDPCVASGIPEIPKIEETTWGKIKAIHR
jgi:hypothetical protein